jgi:hypothetical protein
LGRVVDGMNEKRIIFRGVSVFEDWPERIREAQLETTCVRNGKEMQRVRYGFEKQDWGATDGPCHDCAVIKGEYHVPGCDIERCPVCEGQLWFGCECDEEESDR